MREKTAGQRAADRLRKILRVGSRTRRWRGGEDLHEEMLEAVTHAVTLPGFYSEQTTALLRPLFAAVNAHVKHINGHRVPGELHAMISAMTPWQFAAYLGNMIDAGVTNVGEGECYYRGMAL